MVPERVRCKLCKGVAGDRMDNNRLALVERRKHTPSL